LVRNDKEEKTYDAGKGLAGPEGTAGTLKSELLERGRHALLSRPKGLKTCRRLFAVVLLKSPVNDTIAVVMFSKINLKW
jgi:hypothetical protein